MSQINIEQLKVFLVDIVPPSFPAALIEHRMQELESLVTTYQWVVVVKKIQKRMTPDYRLYIWSGKLEEIKQEMKTIGANLLVIGNILKPSQVFNVSEILRKDNIQIRDRVDLILKIFERHASSTEARLQIELAAIKHMGPRIFGMGMELSRQGSKWSGGGSGASRGLGETNTERMRRHLRDKELAIKKKIEQYEHTRALHRQSRSRQGLQTVGIVGYTNAGKSRLMNALTHKDILVENKLFATLGTSVGKMYVAPNVERLKRGNDQGNEESNGQGEYEHTGRWKEILINDTIGFIRDLPPDLIEAFSSTLEDSIHSDLLLHVVDASDAHIDEKIEVVDSILTKIGATQTKLYVFNKIDLISDSQQENLRKKYEYLRPIFISAERWKGLEALKESVEKALV